MVHSTYIHDIHYRNRSCPSWSSPISAIDDSMDIPPYLHPIDCVGFTLSTRIRYGGDTILSSTIGYIYLFPVLLEASPNQVTYSKLFSSTTSYFNSCTSPTTHCGQIVGF